MAWPLLIPANLTIVSCEALFTSWSEVNDAQSCCCLAAGCILLIPFHNDCRRHFTSFNNFVQCKPLRTGNANLLKSTPTAPMPPQPHQPCSFAFPKWSFGKKTVVWRALQAKWFDSHSWLHYDEANDVVFCYFCKQFAQGVQSID